MRILNLNQSRFEDSELWRAHATPITSLDPTWHQRSLIARIGRLVNISKRFDVILFHRDIRLAAIYGLIKVIVRAKRRLVFQGFEYDVSRYSLLSGSIATVLHNKIGLLLHKLVAHTMNALVVHTSAEVNLYSKFFKVPTSRFRFIPYFHYGNGSDRCSTETSKANSLSNGTNVLAIGRHRDFDCFLRAITGTNWEGVIIAGDLDRNELDGKVPPNVAVQYEVSRTEYRDYIARSTIEVLPLDPNRWQRALGHIAMFEAMLRRKPIIAAQTFQLTDYATENEILYYRPGDAMHLRQQIDRLISDPSLRSRLTENACARLLREFTREKYIADLIGLCEVVSASARSVHV